jgi:catechol 2,3-dioxygenase-like lactoylglutathione lyase family enzyme
MPDTAPRHRIRAMFHATAMVRDYDAAVARLGELIGLRVLEYSAIDDPAIGRRGGMTWIGDGSLELAEPIVAGAPPDRFVQRTGGGMQGVALWVDDFAATTAHLAVQGVAMPVQMPAGFGFSSPRATCGLQLEWSEFTVPEDPRAGAHEPGHSRPPLLAVEQIAFVGAAVERPIDDAARLAALFDTAVTFERAGSPPGAAVAGVAMGDCTLALFPCGADDRPRVSLLGVRVADLDVARVALARAGIGLLSDAHDCLLLDPRATGRVEVAVVDRLLPGDPRP